jgi:spermidine/putrescine transport system permease protein
MTTTDFGPDLDGKRRWFLTVAAFFGPVLFILVPMVLFLSYSFFSVEQGTIVYTPSLGNYIRFFTDPIFVPIFW